MTQTETFEFFDRVYPHYTARPGRKNGSEYIRPVCKTFVYYADTPTAQCCVPD